MKITLLLLVRNVNEKCNREMTRGNARDEPNLSRRSRSGSVAGIIQNELGKAGTTWNQLLLLLLWYLIPKVVKPPPDLHHAAVFSLGILGQAGRLA